LTADGDVDIVALQASVSVVEGLEMGIPEASDPDGRLDMFAANGYPDYSRRHELLLSYLSTYHAAATPMARRDVLLGVCELVHIEPPEADLGREDFNGEGMIRECVELHVRRLEAHEAKLRSLDADAKARRLAQFRSSSKK
jgi:hypothetical protein